MDLNMKLDMGQIKEKLLGVSDKKTLIKFGIGLGSIILFLIIYYAILNPMVNDRKAKFEDKLKKQSEISQFESDIVTLKAYLKKTTPEFEKSSTLFHSKAEVEGLYQTLSVFAGKNNLIISKIEKKDIKATSKAEAIAKASGKKKGKKGSDVKKKENIAYYKIPVDFEITGNFLGYIKFKREVSLSQKMLNFDKESIQVLKGGDTTGAIKVNGTLTIVGLADEFF